MNKIHSIKKQRGVMLLMTALLVSAAALSMTSYMYIKSDMAYGSFDQTEASRDAVINQVREELEDFYVAHANDLAAEELPDYLTAEYVKGQLSIPKNSSVNLKIGITGDYYNDKIAWRDIYAWLPATDGIDDSVFSESGDQSNAFTPGEGVVWTSYSGLAIESQKFIEASNQVDSIADTIRAMYLAKVNGDPLRDQSANYFADCGPRPSYAMKESTLACSGGSQLESLSKMGATDSMGLSASDFKNPWGYSVEGSNETGGLYLNGATHVIQSDEYPYTMIVASETPVGYYIFKYVVQPL